MPIYTYRCKNCSHEFEKLQKISSDALKKCPECGKETLVRLFVAGGGLVFKGSGFYLTDYKKKSTSEASQSSKKSPAKSGAPSKSDSSKPDTSKKADSSSGSEKKSSEPSAPKSSGGEKGGSKEKN
jgi:putative FmdB family regulatory protein